MFALKFIVLASAIAISSAADANAPVTEAPACEPTNGSAMGQFQKVACINTAFRKMHATQKLTFTRRLQVASKKCAAYYCDNRSEIQAGSCPSRVAGEGENVHVSTTSPIPAGGDTPLSTDEIAKEALLKWYNEKPIYAQNGYSSPSCDGSSAQSVQSKEFAQMMWSEATEIGMGGVRCPSDNAFIVVAQYNKAPKPDPTGFCQSYVANVLPPV